MSSEGEGRSGAGAGGDGAPPVVIRDLAAVQAQLEAKLTGTNGNGSSNGNSNGAHTNGNGSAAHATGAALASASIDAADGVEGYLAPEAAGQLEAAAQEALTKRERRAAAAAAEPSASTSAPSSITSEAARMSAAGTPYVQPGGQWSKFKGYSTFQRTWQIWSFGLGFFFRLWLVNQVRGCGAPGRVCVWVGVGRGDGGWQPGGLRAGPNRGWVDSTVHSHSHRPQTTDHSLLPPTHPPPAKQKWTYKKAAGGMSEAAVSARRAALAVWLREGLVKLGPTFIKIGQQVGAVDCG